MADFVRWHSPRDWIADDDTDAGAAKSLGSVESPIDDQAFWPGHFSERMLQPGNVWQRIWNEEVAMPVAQQVSLFDCGKEAEVAFEYLESVQPSELVRQLHASLLQSVCTILADKSNEIFSCPLGGGESEWVFQSALDRLREMCHGFGENSTTDVHRMDEILESIHRVESLQSQLESLVHIIERINEELPDGDQLPMEVQHNLACKLVGEQEHLILDAAERKIVKQMFESLDPASLQAERSPSEEMAASFKEPIRIEREFIFRLVSQRPSPSSRPSAHRMYCKLADDHFRISGGISTDELFG
jgi:Rab3 GTPase-activating protein catalytic subunit